MADRLEFSIGGEDKLARQFRELGPEAVKIAAASLYRSGEKVMTRSKQEYVPVLTGTLRSTGQVRPPEISGNNATVVLGFGGPAAPYAIAVHENPRAGKTGGRSPGGRRYRRWAQQGEWKYLEHPLMEAIPDIEKQLAEDLNRELK